jgi:hypothetical protein
MMKKILTMAAMAILMTACSNDIDEPQAQQQPANTDGMITITAKLAPKSDAGTRAVTPGTDSQSKDIIKVTWAANEHLAILYEVNDEKKLADATITAVDATTGAATMTFAVDGSTADGTACQIVYPLTAAKDDKTGVKDAATLLAAQDGTLNANLDVRVGEGTISTTTPSLAVTTQPVAQFAIFKFTTKNYDASATVSVKPLTITIGTQDYVITPASATNELYVALPAITSQNVTFTGTVGGVMPYKCAKTGVSFAAGNYYQTTLKMLPEGAVAAKFSVAADKKVYFSQGNLQATYDGSAWTWAFAEHQWDRIGNNTGNTSINGNGTVSASNVTVDLFGWVGESSTALTTAPAKYGISNSTTANDYGTSTSDALKSDWGTLAITNGGNTANSGWCTLTKDEWTYLFNGRTSVTTRYCKATVNSKNGVVLFPDSYTHPDGVTAPVSTNTTDAVFSTNSWSGDDWSKMETAGCVFLPVAGFRDGVSVVIIGTYGYYWSSSPYGSSAAYDVYFGEGKIDPADTTNGRKYGFSVRLVRQAE